MQVHLVGKFLWHCMKTVRLWFQTPSINTTNIDTLLVAADRQQSESVMPPDDLQDKVHFLFNNLSSSNLSDKVRECLGCRFISLM